MEKPVIMVVDDEPPITRMLRMVLCNFIACEVKSFNDPLAAVEYFKEHKDGISLVMTDLRMPGLDGIGLCRAVRKESPTVPILILTAFASAEMDSEARQLGVSDILQKPFVPTEFVQTVKKYIESPPAG